MKLAVSVAIVVLLLGMPIGCVLAGLNPAHACCPRTTATSKCPYDVLDAAKIAGVAAAVAVPIVASVIVAPPTQQVVHDLLPEVAEDQPDLYVLNRILRI